ncbi:MAG: nuclear transport factor 2 family protein [Bryobacteraceae bacterium]
MLEQQNTKLVQDAYGAFGRGDIAALLGYLDDSIVWETIHGASPKIPTASKPWLGKSGVAEFFQVLAGEQTFQSFEPREFVAQGDTVVVLGHYESTITHNGKKYASDWVMVFTVSNGKITRFREYADSSALNAAFA